MSCMNFYQLSKSVEDILAIFHNKKKYSLDYRIKTRRIRKKSKQKQTKTEDFSQMT